MTILRVTATTATPAEREAGLLAYLLVEFEGGLLIDGITLRRTVEGLHCLSFPERQARDGRRYPLVRPRDQASRDHLEREVFHHLGIGDRA